MTDEERNKIIQHVAPYVTWSEFQEMKIQVREMHTALVGDEYHQGFLSKFAEYRRDNDARLTTCQENCAKHRTEYWQVINKLKLRVGIIIAVLTTLGVSADKLIGK